MWRFFLWTCLRVFFTRIVKLASQARCELAQDQQYVLLNVNMNTFCKTESNSGKMLHWWLPTEMINIRFRKGARLVLVLRMARVARKQMSLRWRKFRIQPIFSSRWYHFNFRFMVWLTHIYNILLWLVITNPWFQQLAFALYNTNTLNSTTKFNSKSHFATLI